ncbi:hypothetical protein [Acidovorax sp. ACV01]|uniref:hypothetical protein n=1 Tax=Acidovorax sp. ACV01 TaxID=2769311 RepID=UPI001785C877|nr:hypothetical protein [Acidovorax sp. ACV01]MBD9394066.1 hypothetical protein [Acidovorax sp. ACV01]
MEKSTAKEAIAELLYIDRFSERALCLIWIIFAKNYGEFLNIDLKYWAHENLLEYLKTINSRQLNNLRTGLKSMTAIPESKFNWVFNNNRQAIWFIHEIQRHRPQAEISYSRFPQYLTGRSACIALFDYLTENIDIGEKNELLSSVEAAWNEHNLLDQKFAWLNEGNTSERREFFSDWISSPNRLGASSKRIFTSHEKILMLLDEQRYTPERKTILAEKLRTAWNQKQRRKNKNQFNLLLSDTTTRDLKTLAQKYKISQTEIVEILIYSEARDNHHINTRLKYLEAIRNPQEP